MHEEKILSGSLHARSTSPSRRRATRSPSPRRGALLAKLTLPVLTVFLSVLSACADKRISVAELTEREKAVTETPPAPVDLAALALTDVHPYQVRPGDILSIRMFGLADERYTPVALDLRVHDDGRIVPPLVGPIEVQGLTLNQVEQAIIAAHVPKVVKDLSVYVQLADAEMTTVLVFGAATTPGLVKLRQNERNILYALAAAGGFGETATAGGLSRDISGRVRYRPINPAQEEVVYNLADMNDLRRALQAPPLESGDLLIVEAAESSAVYVDGVVNRPGPIMIPPRSTLSVLRAVMAAGGLRDYLDVKDATLIRTGANGEDVHVQLNLSEMLAGRKPDVALLAGDILHIPYTVDTFMQEWFFRNLIPGPFNVGLHYDPLAQYNANRALQQNTGNGGVLQGIRSTLGSTLPQTFIPPVATPAAGQ
jgi:polysaccharide export outer membrane protein